jgi:hypothetical protein
MKMAKELYLRILIFSQESSSNRFLVSAAAILITIGLAVAGYFFGIFIGRSIYKLRVG